MNDHRPWGFGAPGSGSRRTGNGIIGWLPRPERDDGVPLVLRGPAITIEFAELVVELQGRDRDAVLARVVRHNQPPDALRDADVPALKELYSRDDGFRSWFERAVAQARNAELVSPPWPDVGPFTPPRQICGCPGFPHRAPELQAHLAVCAERKAAAREREATEREREEAHVRALTPGSRLGRVISAPMAGECRSCRAPARVLKKAKQGGLWVPLCESCLKRKEDDEVEARALELYAQELLASRRVAWREAHDRAHPPPPPGAIARVAKRVRRSVAAWRDGARETAARLGLHAEAAAANPFTPVVIGLSFVSGGVVAAIAAAFWTVHGFP